MPGPSFRPTLHRVFPTHTPVGLHVLSTLEGSHSALARHPSPASMAEQGAPYPDDKVVEKQTASPGSSSDNEEAGTTGINENALLRKIDLRLLPAVGILYLLSFLDRSNVANARIEGLADDLGMSGNQYLTGLTLYFIGYVLFEIPCNIILKRTSPRLWLPTLTIAWGIVATLLGVVQNLAGFFVARFFLGVTESGLFPGGKQIESLVFEVLCSPQTVADVAKYSCVLLLHVVQAT